MRSLAACSQDGASGSGASVCDTDHTQLRERCRIWGNVSVASFLGGLSYLAEECSSPQWCCLSTALPRRVEGSLNLGNHGHQSGTEAGDRRRRSPGTVFRNNSYREGEQTLTALHTQSSGSGGMRQ